MRSDERSRPAEGRRALARVGGAFLAAVLVAACAGENLFTVPGAGGGLGGPEVDITAPQPNLTLLPGDSVNVTATISGEDITEVVWSGVLEAGGAAAFTPVTVALTAVDDTTMSRYLKRSGATPGAALLIVTAKDLLGDTGADTISVNLGS